ncbi:ornithine--oxo-acid transaminase, partial [Candidatus Saccharibacteria bacterium]|nr:ornithine--oxo-acid transaminase [Candidatus Saccharibacteria bacterium]
MTEKWSANNYHELNDVPIEYGKRAWVCDVNGAWYLDCLAGYSANNFGHRNPRLVAAAKNQLDKLTLTARAFKQDQLEPFCQELGELTGKEAVLPMNTGAEAVETAIKLARKWGQEVKGVETNKANIIVMGDNFHGRTTTIVGFSDDESARNGFGPYAPGFRRVPFGDASAIENAIDENTSAVLLEPIQGEAGVIIPNDGYLHEVRRICTENNVLMIADEIQSGFGRTGETFACDRENVEPDMYVLGKALGGGILPVSAVCANRDIMDVIGPGEHGSTFGGNPLACAVGRAAIELISTGKFQVNAVERGKEMQYGLEKLIGRGVTEVRGVGLWFGVDI